MSRDRLINKLRAQSWFTAVTDWLDREGIAWRVDMTTRCGHPKLFLDLPCGRRVVVSIPCTPRQGFAAQQQVAKVRRAIREAIDGKNPPRTATSAWTAERIGCLVSGINPLAKGGEGTRRPTAR